MHEYKFFYKSYTKINSKYFIFIILMNVVETEM